MTILEKYHQIQLNFQVCDLPLLVQYLYYHMLLLGAAEDATAKGYPSPPTSSTAH